MARRKKSADKLMSRAMEVLAGLVEDAEKDPLAVDAEGGARETLSDRITALSKAVDVFRKVEADAWRTWSPERLRKMTDEQLAEELEQHAARAGVH